MKSLVRIGIPFTCVSLLACTEDEPVQIPISSAQAALTASQNSERGLEGALDALDFLTTSSSIGATVGALGGSSESCSSVGVACPPGETCPPPVTTCSSDEVDEEDLREMQQEMRQAVDDLNRELRERILIDENLESETETSATYLLGASVLCSENGDAAPIAPGDVTLPEPGLDPDCVAEAERLQLRLRLTSPREGDVDVTLLVGSARHAPLTLQMYDASLGLELDLGEALAAARDVGEAPDELQSLDGVVQLQLARNAELDYSFQVNVLEALSIVGQDDDGQSIEASLGASSPTFEVRADGNARSLTTVLDMAALHVMGSLGAFAGMFEDDPGSGGSLVGPAPAPANGGDPFAPAPLPPEPEPAPEPRLYTGMIDALLSGLSGTLTYAGETDSLHLTNLGLGDATSVIRHDDNPLLAVDLNADAGRRFDVLIESLETSGARVTFSPSFEMQIELAFRHVQDQFDDLASFLLDDTLRVALSGSAPTLEIADGQTRVASGALSLTSRKAPAANVSATEGMCLVEADEPSSEHEWLGELAAGVCE